MVRERSLWSEGGWDEEGRRGTRAKPPERTLIDFTSQTRDTEEPCRRRTSGGTRTDERRLLPVGFLTGIYYFVTPTLCPRVQTLTGDRSVLWFYFSVGLQGSCVQVTGEGPETRSRTSGATWTGPGPEYRRTVRAWRYYPCLWSLCRSPVDYDCAVLASVSPSLLDLGPAL